MPGTGISIFGSSLLRCEMKKIRLLVLTSDIPYPLTMGGNIAQYVFTDYLKNKIDITYIFYIKNEHDQINSDSLKRIWTNVNIIDVKQVKTEVKYIYSLNTKIYRLLNKHLPKFSKDILVSKKKRSVFENALWYLRPLEDNYINSIASFFKEQKPDLVQVEHMPFITFADFPTDIPKIFVHHEIQSEMLKSAIRNTQANSIYSEYIISLTETIENSLLRKFKEIIVFSNIDKEKLNIKGIQNVTAIPFPVISESKSQLKLPFRKLTFIGGDNHLPNVDAVKWYKKELGNKVWQETGFKLHIIGKWSEENRLKFSDEFIIFEGFVEDVKKYLEYSIHIVPLRIGSGIRTKILNAFNLKIPVLATDLGAEGILGIEHMVNCYIFQDCKDLVGGIDFLCKNENAINVTDNATLLMKNNYDLEKLAKQRLELYKRILLEYE